MPQEEHFQRLMRLLDLEARAETRQALERVQRLAPADAEATGHCLANLVVREECSGLGGRCVVTLGKRNDAVPLPWTRLGVGSPGTGTMGRHAQKLYYTTRRKLPPRRPTDGPSAGPGSAPPLWR